MKVVPGDAAAVDVVARVLLDDGIAVVPTDTVYGVAVRAGHPGAAATLAAAKGRPAEQAIAVLAAGREEVAGFARLDERAEALAGRFWPGPLTMVLARRPDVDWRLGDPVGTVGVRVPDAPFLAAVIGRVGPLAVTSANRHGQPTPLDAVAAAASLAGSIDVVADGGRCAGTASTVVDLASGAAVVLREGAVTQRAVLDVLEET